MHFYTLNKKPENCKPILIKPIKNIERIDIPPYFIGFRLVEKGWIDRYYIDGTLQSVFFTEDEIEGWSPLEEIIEEWN